MNTLLSQAFVIARRDFTAIVATPTFLLFLLAPFFMLAVSATMGMGAASMAIKNEGRARIVAIARGEDAKRIATADKGLRALYGAGDAPPVLTILPPRQDIQNQIKEALADPSAETRALLYGPIAAPHITYVPPNDRHANYLAELAERTVRDARSGLASDQKITRPVIVATAKEGPSATAQQTSGFGAVFSIFLLTLVLAGQTVGSLAEEKANKVIEILAASVRLEAVFLGKLFGMLGVSIVFVGFWGVFIGLGLQLVPEGTLQSFRPAVGMASFVALSVAYFVMAFLLLGAVFLGVGAQASTVREIQMLSLPITIFQVAMFGLSSAAAGNPGSTLALAAEIFPFSSPFAMAARGAGDPTLWPHFLALAWQALWVGLTILFASRMFRLGVLKSGGGWKTLLGLTPKASLTAV